MSVVDILLAHPSTRIVPCNTTKYSMDGKPSVFSVEFQKYNFEEQIERDFRSLKEWIKAGKDRGKVEHIEQKDEPKTRAAELRISGLTYGSYFQQRFGSQFEGLRGTSFVTPIEAGRLIFPISEGWRKDPSSGRNFYYPFSVPLISIINKGADLLNGNKFRRYPKNHIAPPMIGSVTLEELTKEYTVALVVQEHSLMLQGRTTWTPSPIQVNELNHFFLESGELVPFPDYLHAIRENEEVAINILRTLMDKEVDCMAFPEGANPIEWATDKYIEIVGSHGSYLYYIPGFNTRLIDSSRYSNVKNIVLSQYLGCKSEQEVCAEFMGRVGEYYGITQGLGLTYPAQSQCLLVDTTLGGVTMDIGDLILNPNQEAYVCSFMTSKSTCLYFYRLFFPGANQDDAGFQRAFQEGFVTNLLEYMHRANGLLEDNEWHQEVNNIIQSVEREVDTLTLKINGLPLRTEFVFWN